MRLIYFTNAYPYGIGEQWKTYELNVFKKYFDSITVVPFSYLGNYQHVPFIEGIRYHKPLFEKDISFRLPNVIPSVFFSRHTGRFLQELFTSNAYKSRARTMSWLYASHKANRLINNSRLQEVLGSSDADTVLYFFWGREASEIIPFISKNIRYKKIVSRFHGYDLYKDRNNGYIPYQQQQVKALDLLLPCSSSGRDYFLEEYPGIQASKVWVARLGAVSKGLSPASTDGVLRLITCSGIVPVKRLHLIVEALQYVNVPVEWTHIGTGDLHEHIRQMINELLRDKKNVKVILAGNYPSSAVLEHYIQHPCDLFLNVSEAEGVPVAVMEALSAGIPVYATNVGGTHEIVDGLVGTLLPPNPSAKELAAAIMQFNDLPAQEKLKLRQGAFRRYEERCNAISNAEELVKILTQSESYP